MLSFFGVTLYRGERKSVYDVRSSLCFFFNVCSSRPLCSYEEANVGVVVVVAVLCN